MGEKDSIKNEERLNYYLKEQLYAENQFYELLNGGEEEINVFKYLILGWISFGNIYYEKYENIIHNIFIKKMICFSKFFY